METPNVRTNFIYNSFYQLLTILIPLITTPYLTRVLGANGLGDYSYTFAIASYFVLFMQLGMRNYGNREIAKHRHDKQQLSSVFWELFYLQLSCSLVAGGLYVFYVFTFARQWTMAVVMLPYILSGALDITWFFGGLEDFKVIVGRSTVVKLLTTVGIFLFVKKSSDTLIYAGVMTGGLLLSQVCLWPFLYQRVEQVKTNWDHVVKHLKPSALLFVPIIAVSFYKMMDKIMLGYMTDMAQVGFYESSERIIQIPMALVLSLGTVMLPHMAHLYAHNRAEQARSTFEKSIYLAMFLSTSMCFGIMAVAKTFVPWFYGPDFMICVTLFQILLPSCMFLAFANVIRTQYLIPNEKDIDYTLSVISGAVVNVLINWLLIPYWGAVGAAIGTLCAEITVCVVQVMACRRALAILRYAFNSLPFILAGIIMYLEVLRINFPALPTFVNLSLQCVWGCVIYICTSEILCFFQQKTHIWKFF